MVFGCIFDYDGVLVDSSSDHIESWKELAREEHLNFPGRLFNQSFGMKNEQIIPQLFKWTNDFDEIQRLDRKKESVYREIVRTRGAKSFPGVLPFLSMLREHRVPCAIGSSAPRANITTALESLGFGGFFQWIVCGEDVVVGKPDPQIFLSAARSLGLGPSECIVFEDAHVGVAAARAGGMRVVAVTTTYPRDSLGEADLVVDRLDELTLTHLTRMFGPGPVTRSIASL